MTTLSLIPNRYLRPFTGALLLGVLALALSGCPDPSPTPIEQHGFLLVELDTVWVLGAERYHRIVMRAFPVGWGAGRELRCQIVGGGVATHFQLYDDGSSRIRHDSEGFADTLSGDALAGDGVYTRRVNEGFASNEGRFNLLFAFADPPVSGDTLRSSVRIVRNSAPVVISFSTPDSIRSGHAASEDSVQVVVLDPDGQNDVKSVTVEAIAQEADIEQQFYVAAMDRKNDTTWSLKLPASVAVGAVTGVYEFRPFVRDWILSQAGERAVRGDSSLIWLENLPPRIQNVTGPDTVWVTLNDTTRFQFDVRVADDQSTLDLLFLEMNLTRRNDTDDEDVLLLRKEYFDDGGFADSTSLDTLAGDGVFSAGFSADRNSRRGIPFTFAWNAFDKTGQSGDTIKSVMVIMLEGNGSPRRTMEPIRAGIYVPLEE